MKRILYVCIALALVSCKPEAYTGPLDSPVGNWKGVWSEFYFDSELVGDLSNVCEYSAISFYKDSLCCIEGVKGAFHYSFKEDLLVIDSTSVWSVDELYGDHMVIRHLKDLKPVTYKRFDYINVPVEYKGATIDTCRYGYFYLNEYNDTIQCRPISHMESDSTYTIDFWFDSRSDRYTSF